MRFRPVRHALLVTGAGCIALLAAITLPGSASAQSGRHLWVEFRTAQGCIIYQHFRDDGQGYTEESFRRENSFSYSGTGCRPGQVLNGNGTLTSSWRIRGTVSTVSYTGTISNGVLDGPVTYTADNTPYRWHFTMGCVTRDVAPGRCIPFAGASTRAPAGGSPSGTPGVSGANPGSGAFSPSAANAPASDGDVFDQCTRLEGPDRSGLQHIWQLRNVCQTRISLSYCLQADFEAAGDYNLCTRREYRTHSVAPGATVHFAFNLMPPGTNLSDGRQVTHNTLYVRGYACADDSSPRVHFEDGQLVFRGC